MIDSLIACTNVYLYRLQSNHLQRTVALDNDSSTSEDDQGNQLFRKVQHNSIGQVVEYIDPPTMQECRSSVSAHYLILCCVHECFLQECLTCAVLFLKVMMRGPSSPLEMRVYGCTNVAVGKEVSMDVESVNSVLLDTNPEDPHERWLS